VNSTLKAMVNGGMRSSLLPLVAALRVEQSLLGPERADALFQAYSQALSLAPGHAGEYLRRGFYRLTLRRCGEDFTVGFGTVLSKQGVEVGDRVYVGMRCIIGHARLEDHVTIGSNVEILSGKAQHRFDDVERPIQDQGGRFDTVSIGRNSWLGDGVIVMADIGEACVVGAGSVVTEPLPGRVVAVGNPARVIRER